MRARLLLSGLAVTGAMLASLLAAPSAAPAAASEVTATVTVSAASSGKVAVPDIVGKDGKAAKKALKSAGLKWKWSKNVIAAGNWTVTKTSPKAGTKIKAGGTVKLTVKKRATAKSTTTATPTATTARAAPEAPAAPAPQPAAPAPAPAPPAPAPAPDVFYQNCDAVRAAGKAPLYAGQPGYSTKLDRDKDGVACE